MGRRCRQRCEHDNVVLISCVFYVRCTEPIRNPGHCEVATESPICCMMRVACGALVGSRR